MKIKRLGRTGLKVTELCLGTMTFAAQADEAASRAIMDKAADYGVNFIDTADVYPVPPSVETAGRSEEFIGRWLKGKRDRFILATKCRNKVGPDVNDEGLSRRHILKAADDSLRRLQTDYIDLYQVHAPDLDTPMDETLDALDSLVRAGKVRYLGCSNHAAWQTALALGISQSRGWHRFDSVQPRYNLLFRDIEAELLPLCRDQGLGVICYNPLAGGFLTGKYQSVQTPSEGRFNLGGVTGKLYRDRYFHDAQLEVVRELSTYFQSRGKSLLQVAIAWMLAQPGVTSAILGASKAEQLDASLRACEVTLDADEMRVCNEAWFKLPRPSTPPR